MSLKEVSGLNYEEAVSKFRDLMAEIIGKYEFMLYDHKLSAFQRQRLEEMLLGDWSGVNLSLSLKILSDILFQYYERRVIILIDEHDVPWIRRISTVIMKSWSLLSGAFLELR